MGTSARQEAAPTVAMGTKRLKRPRGSIALVKLIGDIAAGQIEDAVEDKRDPTAVAR